MNSNIRAQNPVTAAYRVAELLRTSQGMVIEIATDGCSFEGTAAGNEGILSVTAASEDGVLTLLCRIARVNRFAKVPVHVLFEQLSALDSRHRLVTEEEDEQSRLLGIELAIAADAPLTVTRLGNLKNELTKIAAIARSFRENIPERGTDSTLRKLWESFGDTLKPVQPLRHISRVPVSLLAAARGAADCMEAALPVAIAASTPLREKFMLAVIAAVFRDRGGASLAEVRDFLPVKSLIELGSRVPGNIACPVRCLGMSSNEQYEMNSRLRVLYGEMRRLPHGMCLTGSIDELNSCLSGGQGASFSPLEPCMFHADGDIPLDMLADFSIDEEAGARGGISATDRRRIRGTIVDALDGLASDERETLLAAAVRREIVLCGSRAAAAAPAHDFVDTLRKRREVVTGMTATAVARRSPAMQQRLIDVVCDPDFERMLGSHILAQDDAIHNLVARLQQEALTRPSNQPVRVLLQGTAATGKSESTRLLASALGWQHGIIDCGGIADYYTFSAQLLGSGRGIVNSNNPGRLESIARQSSGAVLEISDIDHSPQHIRAAICDLFLLALETGVGQASVGGTFNVCNTIICFTANLPGHKDESARNPLGFRDADERDAEDSILRGLREVMSSAFLSRVGTPVLFRPLEGDTLRSIASRELAAAVARAASNDGRQFLEVAVDPRAAEHCVSLAQRRMLSSGARMLLEQARACAADAYIRYRREAAPAAAGGDASADNASADNAPAPCRVRVAFRNHAIRLVPIIS